MTLQHFKFSSTIWSDCTKNSPDNALWSFQRSSSSSGTIRVLWFWISGYQNPNFLSEKVKRSLTSSTIFVICLRIGNINDLVFRYRIMRACNFSENLSPLIKNNYQLFIVERMVLLGAKVLVKTWKENAGDISLSDEKKKKSQRWEPVIVTWAALINLHQNYGDNHRYDFLSTQNDPPRIVSIPWLGALLQFWQGPSGVYWTQKKYVNLGLVTYLSGQKVDSNLKRGPLRCVGLVCQSS